MSHDPGEGRNRPSHGRPGTGLNMHEMIYREWFTPGIGGGGGPPPSPSPPHLPTSHTHTTDFSIPPQGHGQDHI